MMSKKRFPEQILVDFGKADEEGFPNISEAIAFREPLGEYADAFLEEESCRYIRDDIVQKMVDSFLQIIARYVGGDKG